MSIELVQRIAKNPSPFYHARRTVEILERYVIGGNRAYPKKWELTLLHSAYEALGTDPDQRQVLLDPTARADRRNPVTRQRYDYLLRLQKRQQEREKQHEAEQESQDAQDAELAAQRERERSLL